MRRDCSGWKPLPDAPVSIWMEFGVLAILLMNGIMLPLYYRFGPEKARMLYMLMFAGMGACWAEELP